MLRSVDREELRAVLVGGGDRGARSALALFAVVPGVGGSVRASFGEVSAALGDGGKFFAAAATVLPVRLDVAAATLLHVAVGEGTCGWFFGAALLCLAGGSWL